MFLAQIFFLLENTNLKPLRPSIIFLSLPKYIVFKKEKDKKIPEVKIFSFHIFKIKHRILLWEMTLLENIFQFYLKNNFNSFKIKPKYFRLPELNDLFDPKCCLF